jgi:hypothetical protein
MSKKRSSDRSRKVDTGGGAYIEGKVDTGGGDFVGRDQQKGGDFDRDAVEALFEKVYTAIDQKAELSQVDRQDLKAEVADVQAAVEEGEEVEESYITRRLRNIQRMAPDILDVVLETLTNPAAGIALTIRKIAEKMKASA